MSDRRHMNEPEESGRYTISTSSTAAPQAGPSGPAVEEHGYAIGAGSHWPLFTLSLLMVVAVLEVNFLLPLLPRIDETFGVGAGALGWLLGVGSLSLALVAPWAGAWADRRGRRLALLIGVGIQAIATVTQAIAPNFAILMAARIFMGVGGAFIVGTALSYVTFLYPPEKRGRVFGIVGGMQSLGLVLAVPLAGFLGGIYGFRICLGIFAVFIFGVWLVAYARLPTIPVSPNFRPVNLRVLLKHPARRALLLGAFTEGIVIRGTFTMLPMWLETSLNRTSDDVALVFLVVCVSLVAAQPIAGGLSDRYSRIQIQFFGCCGAAAVWAYLPFETNLIVISVLLSFWGFFTALIMTSRQALVSVLVEQRALGIFMGLSFSAWAAGGGLGAVVAGDIAQHWDFTGVGLLAALALLTGGIAVRAFVSENETAGSAPVDTLHQPALSRPGQTDRGLGRAK